jgi:hypothetical protein
MPTVWQAVVRLRLRPSSPRRPSPEFHLQHDVACPLPRRTTTSFASRSSYAGFHTPLLDTDNWTLLVGARLLLTSSGLRIVTGCCVAFGQSGRVYCGEPGDKLVHLFEFWDVLQRRKNDGDARSGCLPACVVLCWIWYHGYLQQQGDWEAGGEPEDGGVGQELCNMVLKGKDLWASARRYALRRRINDGKVA